MGGISSGFQTSSNETIIFLILIVSIVLLMLIAQVVRRKKMAKEAQRRASSGKKPVLRTYSHPSRHRPNLSSREQATFDHLAWFLKDPSKPDRLFSDDTLLMRIARQGIREGVVTEVEVMRLLRRLGVDATPIQGRDRESTAILPTGAELSISTPAMAMGTGEVLLSDEKSIQTRIDKGVSHFKQGDQVDVVCYAHEGMFQFHTTVFSINGKHLNLRHTPHVRHAQRRRYRRREMGMPVRISMPGIDHKPLSSSTVDLSIGGAAVKNPRKKLALGAFIECAIETGGAAPLTVNGTVVRLSRRRKVAHVSFAQMDEKTRHRLFRRLILAG
jgi:hypothetical protein